MRKPRARVKSTSLPTSYIRTGVAAGIIPPVAHATHLIIGTQEGQGPETNAAGTGALLGRLPEQEV